MIKATSGAASIRCISRLRSFVFLTAAAALLAACEPGSNPLASAPKAADATAAAPKAQKSTRIVDRDVEAPQVFQVTDTALWDGRPSLGGVWVASPGVKDPERVIMRNPANGKFVIGALFRREVDNPGPKLQISSDAADALGILAGSPATLSITALRREETADTAPETPILDTAEQLKVAGAGATAAASAAASASGQPGAIDGGGVTTKPLDAPTAPAVAAGTAAAAPKPAAAAAPAAKPAEKPAAKPAAAASSGRPIQIGFFSVEANATRAVEKLSKAGVQSAIRKDSSNGKDYWSVTARGTADTLKKIKSAGFSDAYLLK